MGSPGATSLAANGKSDQQEAMSSLAETLLNNFILH